MIPAKRGEVWFVDLGMPKDDHEQAGRRPVVILQTDDLSPLSTVVIIPFTTQLKRTVSLTLSWSRRRRPGWSVTRLPCVTRSGRSTAAK